MHEFFFIDVIGDMNDPPAFVVKSTVIGVALSPTIYPLLLVNATNNNCKYILLEPMLWFCIKSWAEMFDNIFLNPLNS